MSEDNAAHKDFEPIAGHFIDVMTADMRPPRFIVEELLVPGLMFLIGPPKEVYKSTLTMAFAGLLNGQEAPALPPEWKPRRQGTSMIFSYEADAGELRYTLEKGLGMKWPPDDGVLIAEDPGTYRLDDEDAVEQMLFWLNDRHPTLVVLDPLANFHNVEEKDAGAIIRILSPLRKWAKENDACFLVVHHTRKLPDDSRSYRASDARGTSAIFGLADGLITLSPGKAPLTLGIDAQFKRAKAWQKNVELGAWDNLGKRGGEQLRSLDLMVLRAVANGYDTLEKLSHYLNVKEKEVAKRIDFLRERKHLKKKRGFYEAPNYNGDNES